MVFEYEAILSVQLEGGKRLVSFSAPATEIGAWGGIPQKKRFGEGEETAGFQREDNLKRISSLATFLRDPRNTLQNPLLCSERDARDCKVEFEPLPGYENVGHVRITMPDSQASSLLDVFGRVQAYLEARVPSLQGRKPSDEVMTRLQLRARGDGLIEEGEARPEHDDEDDIDADEAAGGGEEDAGSEKSSTGALFEESHITEFWEEVAARRAILQKVDPGFAGIQFLGFSREALESYIRPVVIMDGQHRLRGALAAAETYLDSPEAKAHAVAEIDAGRDADAVTHELRHRASRKLPISLLLDPSPAEHVFQFVVVNQKATPIGKALLGTIVSTSLSNEELGEVADRLQNAGIPLDESRAASFMARRAPFAGLVDLGMTGDKRNELLPWLVMVSLVQIFRDLEGANLYHQRNIDYARAWSRDNLATSPIVAGFRAKDFETPIEYWRSFEGPWRGVFLTFWTFIRDFFGDTEEKNAHNYWGNPRVSNLFNKPMLHILASDFFRFLLTNEVQLRDVDHVAEECKRWLGKVDPSYFNKDWRLDRAGVKKDSAGIRYAWSKIWDEYRTHPARLPRVEQYSKPTMV